MRVLSIVGLARSGSTLVDILPVRVMRDPFGGARSLRIFARLLVDAIALPERTADTVRERRRGLRP